MEFKVGDFVTRKKHVHDFVFKIVNISKNKATLIGKNVRLCADCYLDELTHLKEERNLQEEVSLPIQKGSYLNGKVLHLDSDIDYLKRSMRLYEQYKVPAIGYKLDEREMPSKIMELLNLHHPDILIITGHDSIDDFGRNVNTPFFVECVKRARTYQPSKDALCIISGACFSSFKDLINEGSNISSSPGRVSINVLDPAKVAIMIATTSVKEYVDLPKIIDLTSNKSKGIGGIETKGFARKIY